MDLLGINRRNRIIADANPRSSIALANDKLAAKRALSDAGMRVPETLATFVGLSDIAIADFDRLPEVLVVKPNKGSKGLGIAVLKRKGGGKWRVGSELWGEREIKNHLNRIFTGEYSASGAHRDTAFFEEHVVPHAVFSELGAQGLPDIRVICHEGDPVQAMIRLPTESSEEKANLHRGAVGLAIDLKSGRCVRAWHNGRAVRRNPDTGEALIGFEVPQWQRVLDQSARAAKVMDLGYCGTDCVLNEAGEIVTIEVNAYPGIEIQNVNNTGLRSLLSERDM